MKQCVFVTSLLLLFTLFSSGCKKDDGGTAPSQGTPPPPEVIGTWVFQSATVGGNPAPLSDVLDWAQNSVSASFSVAATGAYSYREVDGTGAPTFTSSGVISISDSTFAITVNNVGGTPIPPQSVTGTWSLNGNQLRLSTIIGAETVVLVTVKQ